MKLTNFGLNIRLLLTYLFGYKTFRIISAALNNLKGRSQNSLCPVFLTNLEGKVGKVGRVGKVGKVCTEGRLRE